MEQNNSALMQPERSLPEPSPEQPSPGAESREMLGASRGSGGAGEPLCPRGHSHSWETLPGLPLGAIKGLQQRYSFSLQIPAQHFSNTGNKASAVSVWGSAKQIHGTGRDCGVWQRPDGSTCPSLPS